MFKRPRIGRTVFLALIACVMVLGSLTFSDGADEAVLKQLKDKLIISNKVLERERLVDPFGHVSVRIPGTETFLITRSVAPGMATLDDIVVCDMNGKVLEGKYNRTYSEVVIHTEIYKKRKDVHSVVHSHSPYVIALSMTGNTIVPANLSAIGIGPQPIALYKREVFIDTPKLAQEVCDLFGPNKAVILKGHGAVIVGKNIESATYTAKRLEYTAMLQWMAVAIGKLAPITEEDKRRAIEFQERVEKLGSAYQRDWEYLEFAVKK